MDRVDDLQAPAFIGEIARVDNIWGKENYYALTL